MRHRRSPFDAAQPYAGRRFDATVVQRCVASSFSEPPDRARAGWRRGLPRTGLRLIELDALFWGKDWQGAPVELFRHRVERETRDGDWIVVGNYGQVRDLTWRPADTLVWFDLPFPLVSGGCSGEPCAGR